MIISLCLNRENLPQTLALKATAHHKWPNALNPTQLNISRMTSTSMRKNV